MRITGDGIWGEPADRDGAKATLRRAVELGVNFIDTADSYGPDVSETLIAEALHPYPDDLVIATKGGLERTGPGRWPTNGRPQHLRDACEGSLQRLRLDQIPLYQFHRPDPDVPLEDSIGALVELKDAGKVRHIGVCNVTEAQLRRAQRVTPIVSVQNRYNVRDRRSEAMLDLCEQEQIVFLPWGKLVDQWRWRVFSGEIKPADYNKAWWDLRTRYQGVAAPVARSEDDFDPGAKYHVPANYPYTRYFLARILQFQFHRALCQAAGQRGPLHRCSIYGSQAAGERLRRTLAMGTSRPWPDALEALTGQRQMDATAIVDYFAPLKAWLDEQNKGKVCGW
jgi:diketogulonate reductase-like aldo/keto reductase